MDYDGTGDGPGHVIALGTPGAGGPGGDHAEDPYDGAPGGDGRTERLLSLP